MARNYRRALALWAALALLVAPGALASDLASDLGQAMIATNPNEQQNTDITPMGPVDMENADVIIGYVSDEYATVNPIHCTNWTLLSVNQLVFEPVVDLDASLKPIPMLANNWVQDGRDWTFNLRSGIKFHNGYDLTALDVVRSYETILAAGADNPYYSRVQAISSMEAEDLLVVKVHGKNAGLATLYAMNYPVIQYGTLADELPRGTGPYWYIQQNDVGTIRMEANPLWWKVQPEVQSVLLRRYADSGDAIQAIQTNRISMLSTPSAKAALCRKLADLTSLDYPTLTYEALVPNLSDESVMSDVRARQAVMFAIDRAMLASNAYLDMAVQSEVPLPPTSWLYESQSAIYYYSPERALQLINEVGWYDLTGNGTLNKRNGIMLEELNVRIITYNESTNSIRENAANMIAGYLKAVGFNPTVTVVTKARLRELIRARNYDLALVGFNLSEVPGLSPMLSSGGSLNLNNYSNEAMDGLLGQVGSVTDEGELKKLYSDIQMTVVNRLPILGLLFRGGTVLSSRGLGGLYGLRAYDAFNGFEFLKN